MKPSFATLLGAFVVAVGAFPCPPPGNVFPLPTTLSKSDLDKIASAAKAAIESLSEFVGNATFSVEITSPSASFFSYHHKGALLPNSTQTVDSNSAYRIGSISKVFTALSLLLADQDKSSGVHIDDSIVKYFPELAKSQREDGVHWPDVTLRSLAGHLGGINRENAMLDLLLLGPAGTDYTSVGLPPLPQDRSTLMCGTGFGSPECTVENALKFMEAADHGYSQPFDRPSYSNAGFSLLGLALEKAAGKPFPQIAQERIFNKLKMSRSSFAPPKTNGVIPDAPEAMWDVPLLVDDAAGGMYCTSSDMSKFIRGITSATIMSQMQINRWLKPVSYCSSLDCAYGLPWEIYRFANTTKSNRVVDVYTKNGGLGQYSSVMFMLPDWGFGGSVFAAGVGSGALVEEVVMAVSKTIAVELEEAGRRYTKQKYAGSYASTDSKLNSSLVLAVDENEPGISVTSWISNGTDMFSGLKVLAAGEDVNLRIFPMSRNDIPEKPSNTVQFKAITRPKSLEGPGSICFTDNAIVYYAGKPIGDMKFKIDGKGTVTEVNMPALRVSLKKTSGYNKSEL